MKTLRFPLTFLALVSLFAAVSARGAVGVSLTPNTISNDFGGVIQISITGLAAGQSVRVEKSCDYNLNGAYDPSIGELVLESFTLTDGTTPPIFSSVTNRSVPGDLDSVSGTITASFSYAAGSGGNRGSGRFVYRVLNPADSSLLATAVLTVNQAAQAQRITGTVSASGGGTLSNAFVLILGQNGDLVASTLTDVSGSYSMQMPVGNYMINAIKSNFVTLFNASTPVALAASAVATANVVLTNVTRTVSGRVTDAVSSQGVPGIQVTVGNDSPGGFGLAFTDANGNYSIRVAAAPNGVSLSPESLALVGYVAPANDTPFDTTSADVSNVNITVSKATALVYGVVTNKLGQAVGGVPVKMRDQSGTAFRSGGRTAADGKYFAGVLAGNVNINIDSNDLTALGLLADPGNPNTVTAIANGAARADFLLVAPSTHLTGLAIGPSGPLAGIGIYVSPQGGGNGIDVTTAGDGTFDIGVNGGDYYIGISSQDASSRGLIGSYLMLTVVDGLNQSGLRLIALTANRQITGTVTGGGAPLANINVYGYTIVNGTNFSSGANTDASGHYTLNVCDAVNYWSVGVDSQGLASFGYLPLNYQSVSISGANGTANFTATAPDAHVQGQVRDENSNPVAGVSVYAWPSSPGGAFGNAQTDSGGNFDLALAAGDYSIGVSSQSFGPSLVRGANLARTVVKGVNQTGLILDVHTAPRQITGVLMLDGVGQQFVSVYALSSNGSGPYAANAQTDVNGLFSLPSFADTWSVGIGGGMVGPVNVSSRTVSVSTTDVNVAFKIVTSVTQPTMQVRPRVSGQFTLRVPAQNGPRYIIEATGVLPPAPALPTWNTITNTFGTGSPIDVSDPGSAGPSAVQRFYRVRILQ